MKTILLSLLVFLNVLVKAQNFELTSIDNSLYPTVKIVLKTRDNHVDTSEIHLLKDNKKYDFKLRNSENNIPKTTKSLLIFLDVGSISSDSILTEITKSTFNAVSYISKNDFLNIGYSLPNDSAGIKTEFLSAEFTTDHDFIATTLTEKHLEKKSTVNKNNNILESILKSVEFISTRSNKNTGFALLYFCGNISFVNPKLLNKSIIDTKKNEVPIYIIATETVTENTEKNIARLCTESGGVYTNTAHSIIDSALINDLEDIGLNPQNEKSYILTFTADSKSKYELVYKGKKRTINLPYQSLYKIVMRFISDHLLLLFFAMVVVLIILLLIFRHSRKIRILTIYLKILIRKLSNRNTKLLNNLYETPSLLTLNSEKPIHYKLARDITVIGRDADCQICLEDETVSKRHAEIEIQNGKICIYDKGSANGVFVNGKKIVKTTIKKNDIIQLGKTYLKVKK